MQRRTRERDREASRDGTGQILRYEHDTWLRVADNARDLASLVRASSLRHVVFVAHSRGGLVARLAMGLLSQTDPAPT